MRFVAAKSEEQQDRAMLFRTRTRLVHQRTELINMLRAFLYEFGHAVPQGVQQCQRIEAIIEEANSDLPEIVRSECREILDQITGMTARIKCSDERIRAMLTRQENYRDPMAATVA
jgi:transposase